MNKLHEFLSSGCLLPGNSFHTFSSLGSSAQSSDEFWIAWGCPQRTAMAQAGVNCVFAPDFFLEDANPWWIFPYHQKIERAELILLLKDMAQQFLNDLHWKLPHYSRFQQVFENLQMQFKNGQLRKAVPVIFQSAEFSMTLVARAYLLMNLLENTKENRVYPYGLWSEEEGLIGATPEVLFECLQEGILETVALAGTRLHGASQSHGLPPLLEDPKEREEHQIVIDGISSSLKDWGEVKVGATQELTLRALSHLFTPIEVHLKKSQSSSHPQFFKDVIQALHPTPALGAFPKDQGWTWLKELNQSFNRMRMGAPLGVLYENGLSRCWVAIRNIQWKHSHLLMGAGCGVISASQLEREWRELMGKIQTIQKTLGLECS